MQEKKLEFLVHMCYNKWSSLGKNSLDRNIENIIKLSIINSSPYFSIKKLQRKKKNPIEFPFLLSKQNRVMFGLKNLTKNSCHRKLSFEVLGSSNREGLTVSGKKNLHKESFLRKKVANYRWFL